MGWWESEDDQILLGDGPADTLSEALQSAAKHLGRLPTLQEVLDAMDGALKVNLPALIQDSPGQISGLIAVLNSGTKVSSTGSPAPPLVRILYQAFEDITTDYQDMEDHRKPLLRELLGTAAFILRPDDQDFLVTPDGSGVNRIEPIGSLQ